MPVIGEAVLNVIADTTRAQAGITGLDKKLSTLRSATGAAGTALTRGITLPVIGLGIAAVKASIDFESSFAGVRKTVEASEAQFAKLSEGLREMAKQTGTSVVELNQMAETAGALGIEADSLLKFVDVVNQLSVTTNLSADQAADALARIANIMGTTTDEFDNLGSALVHLGNEMAATESEIIDFALRIAGAGKVAGLAESDILAIGAAMASVGVEAEAGGTAVQKVLLAITESVATADDKLVIFAKTAGLSAKDFSTAFKKDAAGAFTKFVEGLGRSGDKAFQILDELGLKDQRLIRAFLSLAGAGDLLSESLDQSTESFSGLNALQREFDERQKTTEQALKKLRARLTDVLIDVGPKILPALESVLKTVAQIAEAFAKLPPGVQENIIKFLALAAVLGPILKLTSGILGLASGVRSLLTAFRGAQVVGATATQLSLFEASATTAAGSAGRLSGLLRGLAAIGRIVVTVVFVTEGLKALSELAGPGATLADKVKELFSGGPAQRITDLTRETQEFARANDVGALAVGRMLKALQESDNQATTLTGFRRIRADLDLVAVAAQAGASVDLVVKALANGASRAEVAAGLMAGTFKGRLGEIAEGLRGIDSQTFGNLRGSIGKVAEQFGVSAKTAKGLQEAANKAGNVSFPTLLSSLRQTLSNLGVSKGKANELLRALEALNGSSTWTHTINTTEFVRRTGALHSGGLVKHAGGVIDKMHSGGIRSDERLAVLQTGEFVIRRSAVDQVGVALLDRINRTTSERRSTDTSGLGGTTHITVNEAVSAEATAEAVAARIAGQVRR